MFFHPSTDLSSIPSIQNAINRLPTYTIIMVGDFNKDLTPEGRDLGHQNILPPT